MKAVYLILLSVIIGNDSFSQSIYIQTSYYGKNLFTLKNLYISYDSSILNSRKQFLNLFEESNFFYIPPEKRVFVIVPQSTFKIMVAFIKENEKPITVIDFPQPFKTIYYVDIMENKTPTKEEVDYVNISFGNDITACKEYFQRLLNIIPDNSENEEVMFQLSQLIDNIEEGSKEHWENVPIPDSVNLRSPEYFRKELEEMPDTDEYKHKRKYYEELLKRDKGIDINAEKKGAINGWIDDSRRR